MNKTRGRWAILESGFERDENEKSGSYCPLLLIFVDRFVGSLAVP